MDSQSMFEALKNQIRQEFVAEINGAVVAGISKKIAPPRVALGRERNTGGPRSGWALRSARAKGEKRTVADFDKIKSAVLAGLKAGPLRAEPLAEAIGFTTKEIRLPISKLLAEKAIRKTGAKRATVYRVA